MNRICKPAHHDSHWKGLVIHDVVDLASFPTRQPCNHRCRCILDMDPGSTTTQCPFGNWQQTALEQVHHSVRASAWPIESSESQTYSLDLSCFRCLQDFVLLGN